MDIPFALKMSMAPLLESTTYSSFAAGSQVSEAHESGSEPPLSASLNANALRTSAAAGVPTIAPASSRVEMEVRRAIRTPFVRAVVQLRSQRAIGHFR